MSAGGYNLSHYSGIGSLTPRPVVQDEAQRGDKPQGLWVSVDGPDDWREWCESEQWGLDSLRNRFVVTLADNADLLLVTTPAELLAFDAEFGTPGKWAVRWHAVAERWQGIIIAPYQWSCRLSAPSWYYTWDCASGCIWDSSAIASVVLTAPVTTSTEQDPS